jgi:histidinol-phosphate aminotransferase
MRTFSKIFGLAGLRLGYAVVDAPLAEMIDVVLEPFNVNRAALAAGRASLDRTGLIEDRRLANEAGRERLAERLREAGTTPYPSQANFLLVDVGVDDLALTEGLARRGFLVRAGSEFGLPGFVRITTGPLPLMERVAAEVADLREKLSAAESPAA